MFDGAGLAVHEGGGTNNFAAEGRANRLMAEAHAQQRHAPCEMADQFDADASFLRGARAGRDHDAIGTKLLNPANRDLVITAHHYLLTQFAEVLHQVVGEGVVIIQNKDHKFSFEFPVSSFEVKNPKPT